jgi:hypothetical protein
MITFGFLTLHAYEHKWFLENLHQYGKGERNHAQKKWHFWANGMRIYYVFSIVSFIAMALLEV